MNNQFTTQQPQQRAPRSQITFNETLEVTCDKCKGKVFNDGMLLRKASMLVTGADRDAYVPIPVFVCCTCGNVNDEFIPQELKTLLKV
jgi:hypothetical protein